jgi:putative transcriptional regulator
MGLDGRHQVAGALGALLLLLLGSWPTSADQAPLTAIFLVARAELPDSNFADSVVLVMNNLGPAPVGLIVNRPTQIAVAQLFPEIKRLAQLHDRVFFGGPVEITSVWFLFRATAPSEHSIRAFEDIYLSADRHLLVKLLDRDKPLEGLRIYVGHCGWAPGQLEAEIARKDWTLEHAESTAIFDGKSRRPWPTPQLPKPNT